MYVKLKEFRALDKVVIKYYCLILNWKYPIILWGHWVKIDLHLKLPIFIYNYRVSFSSYKSLFTQLHTFKEVVVFLFSFPSRKRGSYTVFEYRHLSFFGRGDAISFILSLLILRWICIVRTKFSYDWSHNLGLGLAYKYNFVHWGLSYQGEYNIKLFPRGIKSPRDLFCFVKFHH